VATAALLALLAGCGKSPETNASGTAPEPVDVLAVQTQVFTVSSELPGRVEPVRVAEVRARVAGIVLSRHFREGADVKAGELLFRIDPAPLRAALSRAQGELARAEAALAEAQALLRRYEPLVAIEAVSRQDFDSAQAAQRSAKAARQSALAEVEAAQLNLDYAEVKAPLAGRIGRALVTEGALVGQNEATPMALIQQISPVYVDFQQPAAEAQRLRVAMAEGKLQGASGKDAPVSLTLEGTSVQRQGKLLFSDISVDRATGQLSLRGEFDNRDGLLLPGMYVRVQLHQGQDPAAILLPQRAVQRGADGSAHVLVVDQEQKAQIRPVRTGAMQGALWQITEGLVPGDQVIVGRMAKVQPGSKVAPEPVKPKAADAAASEATAPEAPAPAATK
jgi:multidrug efflux system membrane fusion protein